jgi:hypothetical protein
MPITVQIRDADHRREYSAPFRLVLDFSRYASPTGQEITDYRLRVFVVRIIYTGPDENDNPTLLGPPSERDMVRTLSSSATSRMFPVSGINYTGSITEEFNGDLRLDGSGTCGAGWLALLDMLQKQRAASSTADVVLGLLPDTFPPVPTDPNPTTGCGGFGGVAAAFASSFADSTFRHFTVAHELGHAYGRPHAPCPADPTPNYLDTTYPTYLGCPSGIACPSGSIGEWGFDTTTSALFDPQTFSDFMSHCGRAWVSPHTYLQLFVAILNRDWSRAPTGAAPAPTPEAAVEREYLYLNFRAYRDGRVELLPSFHLSGAAPVPEVEGGPQSRVVCELRDAEGRVIGFHRCHLKDPNVDPDSPYRGYHEMVPWESETRSIRFLRDGEEVAEVEVEQQAPEIRAEQITELDDRRNRVRVGEVARKLL